MQCAPKEILEYPMCSSIRKDPPFGFDGSTGLAEGVTVSHDIAGLLLGWALPYLDIFQCKQHHKLSCKMAELAVLRSSGSSSLFS